MLLVDFDCLKNTKKEPFLMIPEVLNVSKNTSKHKTTCPHTSVTDDTGDFKHEPSSKIDSYVIWNKDKCSCEFVSGHQCDTSHSVG